MRVSGAEVKAIIDTTLTDEEVVPFIRSANLLVTEVLSGEGYSDERLEEIEKWLAAHFVAVRDPRVASQTVGGAAATFHGESGLRLDHTPYGQQAMILEPNGRLSALSAARRVAEVKAIA